MFSVSVQDAVSLYTSIVEAALPIAVVFGLGNVIVNMFMSAMTGGKLHLGE